MGCGRVLMTGSASDSGFFDRKMQVARLWLENASEVIFDESGCCCLPRAGK